MKTKNEILQLPTINGKFSIKKNWKKMIEWVECFNDMVCVSKIQAPLSFVKEFQGIYPKLDYKIHNKKFDFFNSNQIYLVVHLEIEEVYFKIYFFEKNKVEVGYFTLNNNKKVYLQEAFHQDTIHFGWKETLKKIFKIQSHKIQWGQIINIFI